jgi:RNA polymerase sigma factor (sigma-70 family)
VTVDEREWLTERFEEQRPRLRGVAYRMLGSVSEAEDAVQDAWLRLSRTDTSGVDNLAGWLTTVVARVCLNMLRSRRQRREEPLAVHVPDPLLRFDADPEQEALLADSVGLALMVVLETLTPAERLAFVLHDMFAVGFDDIAAMIERSPAAARQLASRARRRVRQVPTPDRDLSRQRAVVDAFFAAARVGDFGALLAVLDPDVVLRADGGTARAKQTAVVHGAKAVAAQAATGSRFVPFAEPVLINGAAGVVVAVNGRLLSVMGFTVVEGRIVAIDVIYDPERLGKMAQSLTSKQQGRQHD